ncbi:putative Fe-S cluster assembly protein SufT [Patescibacteria group bacterium AH-259-L07]|nr:putative Fe-S cluster assembly protein SufT [Patescibacteria group bacterium AH-259-L07]
MKNNEVVTLNRDCEGTLIPKGNKVVLPKGHEVRITQSLGGSYTVVIHDNMVLIDSKDADALGKEPVSSSKDIKQTDNRTIEELVWEQMKTCYDPEIPVNIVDLGLIYSCEIKQLSSGENKVEIKMTLTAPGCGMGDSIADEVKNKVLAVPGVTEASVELVWDPQWNQSMMSEATKLQLGML